MILISRIWKLYFPISPRFHIFRYIMLSVDMMECFQGFFLKSIFLSSMSASIKKGSQNRKSCNKTNKTNRFFLPKIIKVFLSPILQNLKGRSLFDNFFENGPLDEPRKMPPSKKFYLFRKLVKNAKWCSK